MILREVFLGLEPDVGHDGAVVRGVDAVDLLVAARNHCAVLSAEVSDRGIQYVVDLAGGILRRESVLVDRSDIGQERGHRGDDVRTGNGVEVARKDEVSVQFRVADTADLIGLHQAARIARKMAHSERSSPGCDAAQGSR